MNNMACAAGLGAITGLLPREYYQQAINALDQVRGGGPMSSMWSKCFQIQMSGGEAGSQQRALLAECRGADVCRRALRRENDQCTRW